jgi:glycosyltransferase involved in cell wall biosynthesis
MRILQVIYCFGIGGSESLARDIALNTPGNEEHGIIALEHDGPLQQVLKSSGVTTWLVDKQPNERFSPMIRIWKAMREFKPDVVHTHHFYELFYTWPGALLTGTPIIHTEHEYFSLQPSKVRFRLRQLARFCFSVTGVNQETSDFLCDNVGIPKKKVVTIVNGVDLDLFQQQGFNRQVLGLADDDLVVGIVARLEPVKDHAMLIQSFKIVSERIPRAKLLIIGDGSERLKLEQQTGNLGLKDSIRFLGARTDIPEILPCLDVVVLSSKEEGLPLSILEAMAAGKPVIATGVGGIPNVVIDKETGLLVPPGNIEKMSKALVDILSNKDMSDHMGERGYQLVEKHYNQKESLLQLYSLYLQSLEN